MGKKGGGTTTSTQSLDPQMLGFRNETLRVAGDAAGQALPGVDPATLAAMQQYGQFSNAGNLGLAAMGGNQGAVDQMMNPYQHNVIDGINAQYGQMRSQTMNDANAQATAAGAFGGSRHGVMAGVALGQLGQAQGQQVGNALYQGYGDAMNRASGLANLGLGATGMQAQLGQYGRQVGIDQQNHALDTRLRAMQGSPYGTTQSQTQTTQSNPWGTALGLAGTIGGFMLGGPAGAGIGGKLGGLLGGGGGGGGGGTGYNPASFMDSYFG